MKILNKLTIKHLLMNKKRTIVTIIGVILSTALMVGIGLLLSSFRETLVKDAIMYNGRQHITLVAEDDISDKLKENNKVSRYKEIGYIDEYITEDESVYKIYSLDNESLNKFVYTGNLPSNENEIIIPSYAGIEINKIININSKKYTVVGTYTNIGKNEFEYGYNYFIYTINATPKKHVYLIEFKSPKNAYDDIVELVQELNMQVDDISINVTLLALEGALKYGNIMGTIASILMIVLGLISIGCIIVIYNSFAISVMERKKQFGLFSSIGTTKRQLMKTVYFEAIIISLIGIPLGILGAYLGIGTVLKITNSLLKLGDNSLILATYPLFIIIPIIFMLITVLVSAFIPALKASRVSPIEAIRQNDDIKIKSKKLKTPKFVLKLFGIEGELALKNIKRNKKKYRVTIISLFISIVLFITFSSFINYVIGGAKHLTSLPTADIKLYGTLTESEKKTIYNNENVIDYLEVEEITNYLTYDENTFYIYVIDDESYNKLLEKNNKKERKPLVPNKFKRYEYSKNSRKVVFENKLDKVKPLTICVEEEEKCNLVFNDYYLIEEETELTDMFTDSSLYIILTKDMLKDYDKYYKNNYILFKSKNDTELENFIRSELNIEKDSNANQSNYYLVNYKEDYRLENNIFVVIRLFVYGFIALVTLIGVTSVINTINTSIALRKKEFAILRSIGLTSKGFNKMIYFESLFFGLKSLLYALPVSAVIVYFIHLSISEVVVFDSIMLPFTQALYAIIGVFVIILVTMLYASRKIKKDNILEAIREENI